MLTLCLYVTYTEKPVIRRYLLVLFSFVCALMSKPMVITLPVVMMLDRAGLTGSAEVFGARAVIAPKHHSAPETGALAKTASGALERQPYLKVTNLAEANAYVGPAYRDGWTL